MSDNGLKYIPKYLNGQPQVAWWDADEAMILTAGFLLGVVTNNRILFVIFAIIIQKIYTYLKNNRQEGYMQHLAYVFGFVKLRKIPPYYVRTFLK